MINKEVNLKIKLSENGILPSYKSSGASGMDISISHDISLKPNTTTLVSTGVFVEIPQGYELQIRSRSGLAFKSGIIVLNSPGTIDSDYRGEIKIILYNISEKTHSLKKGDRIAQMVLAKVEKAVLNEVTNLSETIRGEKGFGSTDL